MLVALRLLISLCISLNNAEIFCNNTYQCADNVISTSGTSVNCYGYFSCYRSSISQSGSDINCFGSYSCYQSTKLTIDSSASQRINCYGS